MAVVRFPTAARVSDDRTRRNGKKNKKRKEPRDRKWRRRRRRWLLRGRPRRMFVTGTLDCVGWSVRSRERRSLARSLAVPLGAAVRLVRCVCVCSSCRRYQRTLLNDGRGRASRVAAGVRGRRGAAVVAAATSAAGGESATTVSRKTHAGRRVRRVFTSGFPRYGVIGRTAAATVRNHKDE